MYLEAQSKNGIGYTPDWIRFVQDEHYEIVFDILGCVDYDDTTLSCRVKGELVPWVLLNRETQDEISLTDDVNALVCEVPTIESIMRCTDLTQPIVLGIYPVDDTADTSTDVMAEGKG